VLGTALFGLFTVGFTITILAVSLSTIAGDLGTSETTLTWVITGPLLAFGIVGPASGKAGDIWGQKRVFLIGLAGSALFAVGIAAAWDATSLIAFRVLAAASGAACGPAAMALIYSVFPREGRVKAMGYWSMVMAGGPVIGVVAGARSSRRSAGGGSSSSRRRSPCSAWSWRCCSCPRPSAGPTGPASTSSGRSSCRRVSPACCSASTGDRCSGGPPRSCCSASPTRRPP
jgi:MFS family permease